MPSLNSPKNFDSCSSFLNSTSTLLGPEFSTSMLKPDFGEAPARSTVEEPISTVTTPPIRSYERMSVGGGTVVVVVARAEVVVVVEAGSDGVVVVVVGAAVVVVVLLADGAVAAVVEDDASAAVVGTDDSGVATAVVEVVGIIAVGVSVT